MYIQETENAHYSLYVNRFSATKIHVHVHPGNEKLTLLYNTLIGLQQPKYTVMYIQETENAHYSLYVNRSTATKIHVHVHPGNEKLTLLYNTLIGLQQPKYTFMYIQETESLPYSITL